MTAYETGAIAELRKWIKRNRITATIAAALLIVLASATIVITIQKTEVQAKNREVQQRTDQFDLLSGVVRLESAKKKAELLYPAIPEKSADMQSWLEHEARPLMELKERLSETIAELRKHAAPWTDLERASDFAAFGDIEKLQDYTRRRDALQYRISSLSGATVPQIPPLPPALAQLSGHSLANFAWTRVNPDPARRIFGEEPIALAAALESVRRADTSSSGDDATYSLLTLAWAHFANGRDTDALATMDRATQSSSENTKQVVIDAKSALLRAIARGSSEQASALLSEANTAIAALGAEAHKRRTWNFTDRAQEFLHRALSNLQDDLTSFGATQIPRIEERLRWAQGITELTLKHPRAKFTWETARDAIKRADGVVASSRYADSPIDLSPQMGLVPIGMNPVTKLWEFYDLRSAIAPSSQDPRELTIPEMQPDGSVAPADDLGIIFVLLPGGTFQQGALQVDPKSRYFIPGQSDEYAIQEVSVDPFFMAKHEMTGGQWSRLTGEAPSWHRQAVAYDGDAVPCGLMHPVENISWTKADSTLREFGLALPTEAQWEFAARAGTSTQWWSGADPSSLQDAANILDLHAVSKYPGWGKPEGFVDDGFTQIAPVGRFRPNPFGLYDVYGNVWEWCADAYESDYTMMIPRAGDGLRTPPGRGTDKRINRGGGFGAPASRANSWYRNAAAEAFTDFTLGVRASRKLTSRAAK